jgi:maltoporin
MKCYISFILPIVCLSAPVSVAVAAEQPEQSAFQPFEFHSYGRLGIITNEKLNGAGSDQGDGAFGVPTSRHVRDTNYLRLQLLGRASEGNVLNVEAQIGNLAHLSNQWSGADLNIRNAYFETKMSEESELWFGARRLEFEDVRLFDRFPLSDTTFYGVGSRFSLLGAPTTVAVGFKNLDSQLNMAVDPSNVAQGNSDVNVTSRDTSLFIRSDVGAFHPTLILNYRGARILNGVPLTTFKRVDESNTLIDQAAPKKVLTGKLGTSLNVSMEEGGWSNYFAWVEKKVAAGDSAGSDLDTTYGLAGSGYVPIPSQADTLGVLFGVMIEHTQFKNSQVRFALKDNQIVQDADKTSRSGSVVALGLQPVYYVTDRWQAALDLSHTQTSKVGDAKPNMTFVTPIVRYAAARNALASPMFFTSVTYGSYESKVRSNSDGEMSRTGITTQTGCEFWF